MPEPLTPEQRAEWRRLADDSSYVGGCEQELAEGARALDDEVTRLTAEVAAMQAVIADAPHGERCAEQGWIDRADPYLTPNLPRPACTCWKSAAPREALDTMLREAWDRGAVAEANRWLRPPVNPYGADREGADRA